MVQIALTEGQNFNKKEARCFRYIYFSIAVLELSPSQGKGNLILEHSFCEQYRVLLSSAMRGYNMPCFPVHVFQNPHRSCIDDRQSYKRHKHSKSMQVPTLDLILQKCPKSFLINPTQRVMNLVTTL